MQLLWSRQLTDDNPSESNYDGIFYEYDGEVRFVFKNRDGLSVLTENSDAPQAICSGRIPSSRRWVLVDQQDYSYLFFEDNLYRECLREDRAFDLRTLQMTHMLPQAALKDYRAAHKPMKYYEEAPFAHGEYCISHKGEWGYECSINGEKIWQFRGYAWLYTDIHFWNDRVFFGTSGQGGYFYVLDLETGEPLTKRRNGVYRSDRRFVLCSAKWKTGIYCMCGSAGWKDPGNATADGYSRISCGAPKGWTAAPYNYL